LHPPTSSTAHIAPLRPKSRRPRGAPQSQSVTFAKLSHYSCNVYLIKSSFVAVSVTPRYALIHIKSTDDITEVGAPATLGAPYRHHEY